MKKPGTIKTKVVKIKEECPSQLKQEDSKGFKMTTEDINESRKKKNLRSGRLIVRNLSFKCNEDSIRDYFSKLGEVTEVDLLKRGNKLVGCCFVQYKEKLNAAKAIAKLSGQEFMGRPVVVDWAIPKDKFTKSINKEVQEASQSKEKVLSIKKESDSSSDEEEEVDSDEAEVKSESDDSDDDNEPVGKSESDQSDDEPEVKPESDESDDSEDDIPDNDSELQQTKIKLKSEPKPKNKKFHFAYDPKDVSDGRTVFLKNVPFSVNDDDLLLCAQSIGPVVYAVVCMDPLTEHSKGTAFVKFEDRAVAEDLVSGKLKMVLKGVKVEAHIALKKTEVGQKLDHKAPKDNRNLYLLREGIILAGSPAAEGVSEGDMAKRLQLEHWKTQTLKNLSKFVSRNRLVVHNVPPFYDDNKLRAIFKENSPKGSVITEARIIRNLRDIDEKGVGRSKGFGFVTYTQHEHALEALRKINNNPHIFIDKKRPIVGFSIENKLALKIKEKRKAKSQNTVKQPGNNKKKDLNSKNDNKKRKFSQVDGDNVPEFCGYIAKPGAKKMRSGKELKVQAALHHKAIVEKKKFKKKIPFSGRRKNKKQLKK